MQGKEMVMARGEQSGLCRKKERERESLLGTDQLSEYNRQNYRRRKEVVKQVLGYEYSSLVAGLPRPGLICRFFGES